MCNRKKDGRGFNVFGEFETRWHGPVEVKESSMAFEGACCWIFGSLSYSNTPSENAPAFHLKYDDAKALHAALGRFLKAAAADKLTEPVRPARNARPWYSEKSK